jgi:hypothetical protein
MVFVIQYIPKLYIVAPLKRFGTKIQNSYEGDSKVKARKLQTYKGQFKQLQMKEDENIATYFLRVDEIVNAIIGLGE